jgi:hypothetical protein
LLRLLAHRPDWGVVEGLPGLAAAFGAAFKGRSSTPKRSNAPQMVSREVLDEKHWSELQLTLLPILSLTYPTSLALPIRLVKFQ